MQTDSFDIFYADITDLACASDGSPPLLFWLKLLVRTMFIQMEISNVNQLSDEPDIFLPVYSSSAAVNSRWNVEKKWIISLRASSSRVHTLSSPLR